MGYYYDYDYVPEDFDAYEYDPESEHTLEEQSWSGTIRNCVQPSVYQISGYLLALVGGNVVFRILWLACEHYRVYHWVYHLSSVLCGFALLYYTTGYEFLIVLFLCLLSYALILIINYNKWKRIGIIVTISTIVAHVIYESLWKKPEAWQRIRGIQMVASMKIISLGFDLEDSSNHIGRKTKILNSVTSIPGLIPYLGYIFCPATSILGPWISFNCYLQNTRKVYLNTRWIFWIISNVFFAMVFLCMSNCIVPLISLDSSSKWLETYSDALTVRCSHYFISFVSQACLAAANINIYSLEEPSWLFGYMVTKPWSIEFPRSLSSLVRNWNIPMHDWLKRYIFYAVRRRCKFYPLALFSTYVVSSLLHGLHFKIYLVLLSLSLFAYTENVLRSKLATIFNACISANNCKTTCEYGVCIRPIRWRSVLSVGLFNLSFSCLTIINLSYLGIMLGSHDSDLPENSIEIFDIKTELRKWSDLNYFGHWMSLLIYFIYYII